MGLRTNLSLCRYSLHNNYHHLIIGDDTPHDNRPHFDRCILTSGHGKNLVLGDINTRDLSLVTPPRGYKVTDLEVPKLDTGITGTADAQFSCNFISN